MGRRNGTRWIVGAIVAVGCLMAAVLQVRHAEEVLARSGARALQRILGPEVAIDGPIEAYALPRPRLVLSDVHVHDPMGGGDLDVPRIEATQSLRSLLAGRIAFSQLRLIGPTGAVDADRLIEARRHAGFGLFGLSLPSRIVVSDAVLAIRSTHAAERGLLTGFSGVLEGLDRNGLASLSGHGTWHGEHLDVSAHLEPVFDFMRGRNTSGGLKLRSPTFTAAVDGHLRSGVRGGFEGDLTLVTSSLPRMLAENALPGTLGRVAKRASFSASGVANADAITFSNARLQLDDAAFEGSLAWQPNEDHGAWTGTFATDTLDLTGALASLPQPSESTTRWSDARWHLDPAMLGNIDLRVSANTVRIGPMMIEDAAFSALCRDGRLEASLSEARSLDGLIRGRAVVNLEPQTLDVKVDLSLSQVDLEPLFAATGGPQVTGTASGHFAGDAQGWSPKSLVQSLVGHGQISVRQGSLPTLSTFATPVAAGEARRLWPEEGSGGSFDLATADLEVRGDHLSIAHGRVMGSDLPAAFSGEASLLDRSFSLTAGDPGPATRTEAVDVAGRLDPAPRITTTGRSEPSP